ncbi:dynamin family protein [Halomonas qinghailakensis]|uniref:Dynamin family protein n=1 Tax=Halomonas qinghailakensis TaxID=2937790 RepID=A0AA46TP38_9GAMM|nr:dynamin family protein [Halomonas sp. ZZQ-149]UYO73930.1 dynamin family protein [Halomonas sp. ZZQ-149]
MNNPNTLMATLNTHLPKYWQERLKTLSDQVLSPDTPLRVIMLGAFSVGKTSLVNRLLGDDWLETACEETTALPTFIEYGTSCSIELIGSDGSVVPLDANGLARATTQAPEGAACATLAIPLDWLQGVTLIDLPGLGGLSTRNRDYTIAQIQQADAVLYLLPPRGPDSADMATLSEINRYGKRVKVLVARWDEIEEAVIHGEQRPDLDRWSHQIEEQSGVRARLTPIDCNGLGREETLNFIERSRDDLGEIRLRRLRSELSPALENALGQNSDSQRACTAQSEGDTESLRLELLQRRNALIKFKAVHLARAKEARELLSRKAQETVRKERQTLKNTLTLLAESIKDEKSWQGFAEDGVEALRTSLVHLADALSKHSSENTKLDLPDIQVAAFNLRLPPPEKVEVSDFLDMARFAQIQSQLEKHTADLVALEERLAELPETDLTESQCQLRELLMRRDQIATQPLPRIIQQIEGGNVGKILGRMIGEVGDIGLLFINPAWAGAKVASFVGKTSKIVNTTVNATKISENVAKCVKAAQVARTGPITSNVLPPQIADKLKMLESLSLGYWGERIGSSLDGGPEKITVIDPEAQAQQQAALMELNSHASKVRAQLENCEDIANERKLTGWALEQNRKEQMHLQVKLNQVKQRAEERREMYERSVCEERRQKLERYIERALGHWQHSFDQQAGYMCDLLEMRVRDEWDSEIEALLSERLIEIEALNVRIESAPAEREAALEKLRLEANGLRAALSALE